MILNMFPLGVSILILITIFPLNQCRVKRDIKAQLELESLTSIVTEVSVEINELVLNPRLLTAKITSATFDQINRIKDELQNIKEKLDMNKDNLDNFPSETDMDAQVQIKVLQATLKRAEEKLQHVTKKHEQTKGRVEGIMKGVKNVIKDTAKTVGKITRKIKEAIGTGVAHVSDVASSLYNSAVKTGSHVYNAFNEAVF